VASALRPARFIVLIAAALLLAYLYIWSQVSTLEIGRSDFTSTYVGATLLRTGHGSQLYDAAAQAPLHAALIAPDTEGNLPFVDAPLAAAVAAPVTLLPLTAAYWLWSVLQLAVLAVAVLIAVRAAPWPPTTRPAWKAAAALLALAGAGTMVQLLQAQWAPVTALGLALAYSDWRGGHQFRGAALLVLCTGIAKPHLAVGLLAFMLGWRQRRVILGALAGGAVAAAGSLAVAGPSGIAQFVSLAVTSNEQWQLRSFSGFVGIPGSFLGNSGTAQLIGAAGSVAALAAAFAFGAMVRRDSRRMDVAQAGAAALSLLAAPHAGTHDLVMLAPAMAWSLAAGLAIDTERAARGAMPSRPPATLVAAGLIALLSVAAFVSLADGASLPLGQLAPWVLILAAVVAWRAVRGPATGGHPLTSPADATAVGALADGVRRRPGGGGGGLFPLPRRSS
jgi:Glycosyltransferase family 87